MNRQKGIPIVLVSIVAVIILGEVFVYGGDMHHYDSEITWSEDQVHIELGASDSVNYDVVLMEGQTEMKRLFFYFDEQYDGHLDLDFEFVQMDGFLEIRGFVDVAPCDSEEILEVLSEYNPAETGILVITPILPSTIYSGHSDDPLLKWVDEGGHLYWSGSEIGRHFRDDSGIHTVKECQTLFLGGEHQNAHMDLFAEEIIDNGFTDSLSLGISNVMFGATTHGVPDSLSIGYEASGYSTISFFGRGLGTVCLIGGAIETTYYSDISQIIAAGIDHDTSLIDHEEGKIVRGTVDETMDVSGLTRPGVYAYMGGIYGVYGVKSIA